MSREEKNRLNYTIALIAEFASRFGIAERQALYHGSNFQSGAIEYKL